MSLEASTHPLDITTPRPLYTAEPAYASPPRLAGHEHVQALTAMHHARKLYPGVVGEVLAGEIAAYKELGCVAHPSSAVVRLIRDLMQPARPARDTQSRA